MDLLLQVSLILLLDFSILLNELGIPLTHPVLTRSAHTTELLSLRFDVFQFREISFALELTALGAQSVLHFILRDDGSSFFLLVILTLLNGIVPHLQVVHHYFLILVAPIDIVDASLTRMKVPHMFGPVQTPHFFPTMA